MPWSILLLLAILLGSGLVGWGVAHLMRGVLRRLAQKTPSTADARFVDAARRPLAFLVSIVTAGIAVPLAARYLPPGSAEWTSRLASGALILATAYAIAHLATAALTQRARREPRLRNVTDLTGRLLSAVVYAMAILLVMDRYGVPITPVLTGLGVAGIAVALALQDTLANFFAGLWIQSGRTIQPGHYIKVAEGFEGVLERVGWRTTTFRTLSHNTIVVPNSKLAQSVLVDYDSPYPRLGISIPVLVPYEADVDAVESLLVGAARDAARDLSAVLLDPAPTATLVPGFTEAGIQWSVNVQCATYRDQFKVQHAVRRRIVMALREAGIPQPHKVDGPHKAAPGDARTPHDAATDRHPAGR